MAEALPESLKIPEVSRFIKRAGQLRSVKPAVAYWCEYRAVNQIVGKGLHSADDEALAFTTNLMDRLEATKAEHAAEEAITDNDVAKVYIEQFAQQTFDRAERTLRADKVTRQTADTFDAAATFFDLLREWGELEPETLQKIKFAKWNAARILKALREGRDPNESNPKQPELPEAGDETAGLDPNDPDVQQLSALGITPQPATVQDAPDAGEPLANPSSPPQPPAATEGYFPAGPYPSQPTPGFAVPPSVPESMPGAAVPQDPASVASSIPPGPSPHLPTKLPSPFPPPSASALPGSAASSVAPPIPQQPSAPSLPHPMPAPAPAAAPVTSAPPPVAHYKDLNQAQKHAKWAISALNFEDVPTAVQELRNALAALGVQ